MCPVQITENYYTVLTKAHTTTQCWLKYTELDIYIQAVSSALESSVNCPASSILENLDCNSTLNDWWWILWDLEGTERSQWWGCALYLRDRLDSTRPHFKNPVELGQESRWLMKAGSSGLTIWILIALVRIEEEISSSWPWIRISYSGEELTIEWKLKTVVSSKLTWFVDAVTCWLCSGVWI